MIHVHVDTHIFKVSVVQLIVPKWTGGEWNGEGGDGRGQERGYGDMSCNF